jgi:glycosyltransferase involved in cell wall biosynthesis
MRVLIVEEGLQTLHGHYFQYIRDLAQAGRRLGHQIDILAHCKASDKIIEATGANPWLTHSVHDRRPAKSPFTRINAIVGHNRALHKEVLEWCHQSGNRYDVTIFPSVRIDHLWAIKRLSESEGECRLGHLLAIMIDAPGLRDDNGKYSFPHSSYPLKLLLKWISQRRRGDRLIFAAESEAMAKQFKVFCGIDFLTVPHVTMIPPEIIWRGVRDGVLPQKIRFGVFGFTRYDKGLDVLQDAIKRMTGPERASLEFILQWTGDYLLPCGKNITKDHELLKSEAVSYIPAFEDSNEYYEWLQKIDAIILPYRKEFYLDRMSRVAVDAALAGLPVVYPRETWLEGFHANYGAGVPFSAGDSFSLAEGILRLTASFREHSAVAINNISRTRNDFSGEKFFSIVEQVLHYKRAQS